MGGYMKGLVKWFEGAPFWLKLILALPVLDIVWAIFRIVKGVVKGKLSLVLVGILWIILGWGILWIIDFVSIIIKKHPVLA